MPEIQDIISEIADIRESYGTNLLSPAESVPAWAFQRSERIRRAKGVYGQIAALLAREGLLSETERKTSIYSAARIEGTWDGWLTTVEIIAGTPKLGTAPEAVLEGWLRRFRLAAACFSEHVTQGKPLPLPRK